MDNQTRAARTIIATWFVSDDEISATYFPQVGGRSNDNKIKHFYWRCILAFYTTSVAVNDGRRHLFFTNTILPVIDGHNFAKLFTKLNVEVITLPITYRLPAGRVTAWGNQFYIFDIINALARRDDFDRVIILDSDCVWTKECSALEDDIDLDGILSYEVDIAEHPHGLPVNGRSREQLAVFAQSYSDRPLGPYIAYFGGEFFAAARSSLAYLTDIVPRIWKDVYQGTPDSPLEEAHLLSVIYAIGGYKQGVGNHYIKRMWTTFRYHNVSIDDVEKMIWHLPAEKKSGFVELFNECVKFIEGGDLQTRRIEVARLARIMGIPRRNLRKFLSDFSTKVQERLRFQVH